MGWGDEIMAIGHAKAASKLSDSGKVQIIDLHGRPRWDEMWRHVPFIYQPGDPIPAKPLWIRNGSGCRPYLNSISVHDGSKFNMEYSVAKFRPELWININEMTEARRLVGEDKFYVIEPNMIRKSCKNKIIPFETWQKVVTNLPHYKWVQLVWDHKMPILKGVTPIVVNSYRQSSCIIALSEGVVAGEGGSIHAAAASQRPATVVMTGMAPRDIMHYPDHAIVYNHGHDGCGKWMDCPQCQNFARQLDWRHIVQTIKYMPATHKNYWSTHLP